MKLRTAMRKSLLGAALVASGCGDDAQPGVVVLETQHTVDGNPLVLHDVRYTNAAGQTYGVDFLQYYLSDVVLHRSDGATYGLGAALYNDVEDPATLQHRLEQVPPGNYTSITFTWGLDEEKNLPGALPDNLENNNMVWPAPLGGGYHYSKCEGFYLNAQGAQAGYATHMGRVRRDTDSEDHHHFFTVNLSIALSVDGDTSTLPIVMDVNQWYEEPNTYDFPEIPMIMGDLDRQRMLMENGPTVFSVGGISTP
jgi:hypothetical protein